MRLGAIYQITKNTTIFTPAQIKPFLIAVIYTPLCFMFTTFKNKILHKQINAKFYFDKSFFFIQISINLQ